MGLFSQFSTRAHPSEAFRKRKAIVRSGFVFALFKNGVVIEVLRRASGPLLAMLAVGLFLHFDVRQSPDLGAIAGLSDAPLTLQYFLCQHATKALASGGG